MTSNRRMFSIRSPVHKRETADQNDCDGDEQYDHGLRASLLGPIEGSPQVEKPSITRHPITGEEADVYAGHQIETVRAKEVWS